MYKTWILGLSVLALTTGAKAIDAGIAATTQSYESSQQQHEHVSSVRAQTTTMTSGSLPVSTYTNASSGTASMGCSKFHTEISHTSASGGAEADAPVPSPDEGDFLIREQSIEGGGPPDEDADVAEIPAEPPMDWMELLEEDMEESDVCSSNEFRSVPGTTLCQTCDPHCVADRCVDYLGCVRCNEGYYYIRPGVGAPFECRECRIPQCTHCHNGATFIGEPPKCIACEEGFRPSIDSRRCDPVTKPTAQPESAPQSPPSAHSLDVAHSTEAAEVNVTTEQTEEHISRCGGNFFMDGTTRSCVRCDEHSVQGGCRDYIGCLGCMAGFFRRRTTSSAPFVCYPCTIANCAVCVDDIPFNIPLQCEACDEGFEVDPRTQLCISALNPQQSN